MSDKKYMNLLLVKPISGGMGKMVLCESHEAAVGNLVRFGGNEIGTVEMIAWVGAEDEETVRLLREAGAVCDAVEVYRKTWENERNLQLTGR